MQRVHILCFPPFLPARGEWSGKSCNTYRYCYIDIILLNRFSVNPRRPGFEEGTKLKRLCQIGNNVIDMFRPDRKADGIGFNTLVGKFIGTKLGMCGTCGVYHQ